MVIDRGDGKYGKFGSQKAMASMSTLAELRPNRGSDSRESSGMIGIGRHRRGGCCRSNNASCCFQPFLAGAGHLAVASKDRR